MHVHWKSLCSLGLMFWAGMSAIDKYYGSILIPEEFFNHIEPEIDIPEPSQEKEISPPQETNLPIMESSYFNDLILFVITIALSIFFTVCKITYKKNFSQCKQSTIEEGLSVPPPNLLDSAPGDKLILIDEPKLELCPSHHFKTKDENVETTTSWKELIALSKRVDTLEEEKRNLGKVLSQAEKDNRGIKQKMMEILRDKNVLLKRLECATREIRSNTIARQATLTKLEESLQCSTQLKMQVQQITTEKKTLERKIKKLEAQLRMSKKPIGKQSTDIASNPNSASNNNSYMSPIDSGRDIEKIESKLHDLEASLEQMKCKRFPLDDCDSEGNETSDSYSESKILRQVSSHDMTFLSEVEPSYTNLLTQFDGKHHIVESIQPENVACKLTTTPANNKFHVLNNLFGSAISRLLLNIQRNQAECMNSIVRRYDPVVINYTIDCKCLRQWMLLSNNCFIDAVHQLAIEDFDNEQKQKPKQESGDYVEQLDLGCQTNNVNVS